MEIEDYFNEFLRIEKERASELEIKHSLVVKTGMNDDGSLAIFKLLQEHWSTTPRSVLGNNGVFFCMWIEAKDLKKNKVSYGVHQLKLKEILGPKVKPGEFVDSFRAIARGKLINLPNVQIDIGPVYLYRGWFISTSNDLVSSSKLIIASFVSVASVINELLRERRAKRKAV